MMDLPPLSSILKTSKPFLPAAFLCLVFFIALCVGEYLDYRKFLLRTIEPTNITVINPSPTSSDNNPQISWRIFTPSSYTQTTSIFYDYESSPSALLTTDSPQAAGYQFQTTDYIKGSFPLPATFISNLNLPHSGTIYYRAYTFLNDQHLWTPEFSILIP